MDHYYPADQPYRLQPSPITIGSRWAAMLLSGLSALSSLIVIVSYIRMLRQFRAHQRRIIGATMGPATAGPAAVSPSAATGTNILPLHSANGLATNCFSCESSLATPCVSKSFFSSGNYNHNNSNNSNGNNTSSSNNNNNNNRSRTNTTGARSSNIENNSNHSSGEANRSNCHHAALRVLPTSQQNRCQRRQQHQHQRSSMPPLPNTPLNADAPLATREGSRATSLDRVYAGCQTIRLPPLVSAPTPDPISAQTSEAASSEPVSARSGEARSAGIYSSEGSGAIPGIYIEGSGSGSGITTESGTKAQVSNQLESQGHKGNKWWRRWLSWPMARRKGGRAIDIFGTRRRRRLPRIPSSKIAVLSAIDLLLHVLWIVNNSSLATDQSGCTATLFFYQWVQLFYLFFLASFVSRSAMRLRNLQPVQPKKQRRTDLIYSGATLAASLVLSLLPAVMYSSAYDDQLLTCWFDSGSPIAARWLWMTLNIWVVLSLVFLIANSIYVAVILSNERRDLLSFIAHPMMHGNAPMGAADEHQRLKLADPPAFYIRRMESNPAVVSARSRLSAARLSMNQITPSMLGQYYYTSSQNQQQQQQQQHQSAMAVGAIRHSSNSNGNSNGNGNANRVTLVNYDHKTHGSGIVGGFGVKSTPLTSRESLGVSRRLSAYPATHPVALAHEALHGRRPVAVGSSRSSSSRGSEIYGAAIYPTLGRSLAAPGQRTSRGSSSRPSSSGSNNRHSTGIAGQATTTTPTTDRDMRVPSIRAYAPPWDSSSRRLLLHQSSFGSSVVTPAESVATSTRRPLYGFYAQRPIPDTQSPRRAPRHMSMPAAACSSSSDIPAVPNPHRRVSVAAAAAAAVPRYHARQQSMPADAADQDYLAASQRQRGIAPSRHSRMPRRSRHSMDPRVSDAVSAASSSAAAAAPGRTPSYMPSIHEDFVRTDDEDSHDSRPTSKPLPLVDAPPGISPADLAILATTTQQSQLDDTRMNSISHLAESPTKAGRQAPVHVPARVAAGQKPQHTNEREPSGFFSSSYRRIFHPAVTTATATPATATANRGANHASVNIGTKGRTHKAQGQIQRIERRVHTLVATGALRVATRAMVPLLTQLAMVIWSTVHALGRHHGANPTLYAAAILLLSLQGTLDMALYFIFDTHSDTSEVSLPSCSAATAAIATSVTGPTSIPAAGLSHQILVSNSHGHIPYPSLQHLHGDVYLAPVSPGGSYDLHAGMYDGTYHTQPSMRYWNHSRRYSSNYHQQQAYYYRRSTSLSSALSYKSNLSGPGNMATSIHSAGAATPNVAAIIAANHMPAIGGSRNSRGSSMPRGSTERNFTFNVDSLNIRRVDRTSNAMQSDTLHGSDCVAWSHTDGLSIHDATSSISLFSATPAHHHHHRPVLSGWEEIELEDIHPSSADQQYRAESWE